MGKSYSNKNNKFQNNPRIKRWNEMESEINKNLYKTLDFLDFVARQLNKDLSNTENVSYIINVLKQEGNYKLYESLYESQKKRKRSRNYAKKAKSRQNYYHANNINPKHK